MNRSLRVVAAGDSAYLCRAHERMLRLLGHQVVTVRTGRALVECCAAVRPDLVLASATMPDVDGIAAAEEVYQAAPLPVILVTGPRDPDLAERVGRSNAMTCLANPVTPAGLAPALALALRRFEETQALRREVDGLRQALEDRKVVERAKGVVMRRIGVCEDEAFRRLRMLAGRENRKLPDLAQAVLRAEEVFVPMEQARSPNAGGGPARVTTLRANACT